MNLQLIPFLQSQQQITVACDQGALRDDAEREAFAARQPLQHGARHSKSSLGGLIRVGRCADDDAFAHRHALEIGVECAHDLLLHENSRFEGFPPVRAAVIGEFAVGQLARVVRSLDDIAMRVPRVAVAAAELAADIGIERPVVHPGCAGRVENAVRRDRDEASAAEAFI